jgi:CheY-like chemotaxis protein
VEDEDELRKLYQSILAPLLPDFRIINASNGYEAMRAVYLQLPSLVITDHDMPLMSGTQLVEAVRKKDKYNEVPVIVISANLDSGSLQKYKRLGVQHLIDKPFEIEELSETVQNIINEYLT